MIERPVYKLGPLEKKLFAAVNHGDAAKVKELLEGGADVNAVHSVPKSWEYDVRPIHLAAELGHAEVVKILLTAGADPNKESKHLQDDSARGETALHWACGLRTGSRKPDLDLVRLLLDAGCDPNHRFFKRNESVFEYSIFRGRLELVKLLVEYGADINPPAGAGTSPLMRAIAHEDTEMAKWLLDHGAAADFKDRDGWTVLMAAVQGKQLEIVKLLLPNRPPLEERERNGYTALILAARNAADCYDQKSGVKCLTIIQALIEAGADMNACSSKGYSVLDFAAWSTTPGDPKWYSGAADYLKSIGAKLGTAKPPNR